MLSYSSLDDTSTYTCLAHVTGIVAKVRTRTFETPLCGRLASCEAFFYISTARVDTAGLNVEIRATHLSQIDISFLLRDKQEVIIDVGSELRYHSRFTKDTMLGFRLKLQSKLRRGMALRL